VQGLKGGRRLRCSSLFKKKSDFFTILNVFFSCRLYSIFEKLSVLQNCNILVIFKDTDLARPPLEDHKRLHLNDPKPQLQFTGVIFKF